LILIGVDSDSAVSDTSVRLVIANLLAVTRETDVVGWYEGNTTAAAMLTELAPQDPHVALAAASRKIANILESSLTEEQRHRVSVSFHIFPDKWVGATTGLPGDRKLYPDLRPQGLGRPWARTVKRIVDVAISMTALIVLSPMFVVIALTIKLTSSGPVLFRQRRIGQHGAPFICLKFRSMYDHNDCTRHRDYVRQLIAGTAPKNAANGNGEAVYKLTADARVTRFGALLRRTSLDELPQLINVLSGEMSLVGPRPPIDYEIEDYEPWHRRRVVEAKPGITGLWQVNGRNRTTFDDMVRLDLRYAQAWTPWLDLRIILRTPTAIAHGAH
jgi:lipopolysaccharide/colanic/teichoic acid biosynthesis glycosyltransferase